MFLINEIKPVFDYFVSYLVRKEMVRGVVCSLPFGTFPIRLLEFSWNTARTAANQKRRYVKSMF